MTAEISSVLDGYLREAIDLRMGADLPSPAADAVELRSLLLDTRRRQDRVEELLRNTIRIRARAQRAQHAAQAAADDAFDEAIHRQRGAPVTTGGEFSSARERTAQANLTTMDARHAARHAGELAHVCDEAVEVLRSTFWGLSGVREDIRDMLRALAFESHLER